MALVVTIVFALTYLGMALGRAPGLKIDRTGIAMIAAAVMVAVGALPAGEVASAVHFPTLLLMGGLMILSSRMGAAGFYDAAAAWIARQAGRPLYLLALTVAVGGGLSAVLVNDIVVFAMAPLLCAGLAERRLDPRPLSVRARRRQQRGLGGDPDRQSPEHPAGPGGKSRLLILLRGRRRAGGRRLARHVRLYRLDVAIVPQRAAGRRAGQGVRLRRAAERRVRRGPRAAARPVRHALSARDVGARGRGVPRGEPHRAQPTAFRRDRSAASDPVRLAVRRERGLRPHRACRACPAGTRRPGPV